MSESTPDVLVHPEFDHSDADVILVSSDGVQFKVHKKRLGASSIVFEDMFEIGSGGGVAEVPVAESSEVLEAVLPYCYPVRNPAFDLTRPCAVDVIRTFDKYDLNRGIEVAAAAFELHIIDAPESAHAVAGYFWFATRFNPDRLDYAVRRVLDSQLSWAKLEPVFRSAAGDDGLAERSIQQLKALLDERAAVVALRGSSLLLVMSNSLRSIARPNRSAVSRAGRPQKATAYDYQLSEARLYQTALRGMKVLAKAIECTSLEGLTRFREAHPINHEEVEIVPWADLEQAYRDLPTMLR